MTSKDKVYFITETNSNTTTMTPAIDKETKKQNNRERNARLSKNFDVVTELNKLSDFLFDEWPEEMSDVNEGKESTIGLAIRLLSVHRNCW